MYRVTIESLLGIKREGDTLRIDPSVPGQWPGYRVTYRIPGAEYLIDVENPEGTGWGVRSLTLDGDLVDGGTIPLEPGSGRRNVRVVLGSGTPVTSR